MANKIIIKNSAVGKKKPTPGDLNNGELAINLTDQQLYSKDTSNTVFKVGYSVKDYVASSAGAADAGKPVVLDPTGAIDLTMLAPNSMVMRGTIDVTGTPPLGVVAGSVYTSTAGGVAASTFPGISGLKIPPGSSVSYDGANWHAYSSAQNGLTMAGNIDVTAPPPAGALKGDTYLVTKTGIAVAGFTGIAGERVQVGSSVAYDGTTWHHHDNGKNALRLMGSTDVTAAAPTAIAGDVYFATVDGVAHSSFPGIAGETIKAGSQIIFDGTNWQSPDLAFSKLLPGGGTTNQVLAKIDGTDGNAHWVDKFSESDAIDVFTAGAAGQNKVVKTDATTGKLNNTLLRASDKYVAGSAGVGLLIETNAAGKMDPTFMPVDTLNIKGAIDFTKANAVSSPAIGDAHFANASGPAHSTWTGIAGEDIKSGDMVLWGSDGKWHHIPNGTDLNAYLPLAGGTMNATAHVTAAAAPTAGDHLVNKTYADQVGVPVGGAINQVLAKKSAASRDAEWITPTASLPLAGGTMTTTAHITAAAAPTTGNHLTNRTYVDKKAALYLPLGGGHVTGNVRIDGTLDQRGLTTHGSKVTITAGGLAVTGATTVTGAITATADITAFSDMRLKRKTGDVSYTAEEACRIEPITYFPNEDGLKAGMPAKEMLGVSAQQIETIAPDLVHTLEDGTKTVDYGRLSIVLLSALQDLTKRVQQLEAK